MFSSSSCNSGTVSPFQPNFPFSSSSSNYHPPLPPPPCVNLETCTGDIFLHHIHDPLSGQFSHQNIALMAPPSHQTLTHLGVSSNIGPASINAAISSSCGDHHHHHHQYYNSNYGSISNDNIIPYFLHSSGEDVIAPAATKKDRHSKIFTAQGLRDRRVRLSINVARQFFDLQDLLGFDRASQTLEWLLNKSRTAIRDLGTRQKNLSCSSERSQSLSSTSDCDVVSDTNEVENHVVSKAKETVMMKKLKKSESAGAYVAKESRAKARARARERTTEKKRCTSKRPHQILNQLNLFIEQLDDHETNISSSSKVNFGDHYVNQELGSLLANQTHHHHRHEEDQSTVIKRNKMKSISSLVSNYNTTDQSSSNSHLQFPNASQSWDINGAFPMP